MGMSLSTAPSVAPLNIKIAKKTKLKTRIFLLFVKFWDPKAFNAYFKNGVLFLARKTREIKGIPFSDNRQTQYSMGSCTRSLYCVDGEETWGMFWQVFTKYHGLFSCFLSVRCWSTHKRFEMLGIAPEVCMNFFGEIIKGPKSRGRNIFVWYDYCSTGKDRLKHCVVQWACHVI